MEGQRSERTASSQLPGVEYQYVVHVKAMEALANTLSPLGIMIPQASFPKVTFRASRLLPMKQYKERGLVWSYTITRIRFQEEIVEEG